MRVLSASLAILIGGVVLAGYFVPALADIQSMLLGWAMILAGWATLLGVLNLIWVHGEKIHRREKGNFYSILLLLSLVTTLVFGLGNSLLRFYKVPAYPMEQLVVQGILAPGEASLLAILTVTLLYTAMRLLRRRIDLMSVVFVGTVVLVLLTSAVLPLGEALNLTGVHAWINQVLALGGARGILIGVALGTLTTGLRVLFAIDRPYGGK
jgi:hypothetical protein